MGMTLKQMKSKYICVVSPRKRKVYDFKKKKQIKFRSNDGNTHNPDGTPIKNRMPTIGFMANCCNEYNSFEKIYYVDKKLMHESCAMAHLNGYEKPEEVFDATITSEDYGR